LNIVNGELIRAGLLAGQRRWRWLGLIAPAAGKHRCNQYGYASRSKETFIH